MITRSLSARQAEEFGSLIGSVSIASIILIFLSLSVLVLLALAYLVTQRLD